MDHNGVTDMIKKAFLFVALTLPLMCFSQGEIMHQKDLNFYSENSMGFKFHSSGYGLDYRFEYRYTNKLRGFLETEFNCIKSPKEIKLYNPFFTNQKKFVYGKANNFYNIKVGVGIQKELFSKQDKNSLSIRYQLAIGGILGIEKPVYYNIVDSSDFTGNQQNFYYSPQLFNIDIHNPTDIISRESYFTGISETHFTPGIYLRAGLNFEFSNDLLKTKAIEIGTEFDAYLQKITIMAGNEQSFFLTIYCSYRFGYKYSTLLSRDARKFLRKQEKKE